MTELLPAKAFDGASPLDRTDWRILQALQRDARLSMAALARRVGMSAPAVRDRVGKLERAGIITGYRAQIDLARVGRPMLAFLRIGAARDVKDAVAEVAAGLPEVLECHRGTGNDCIILKVAVAGTPQLEAITGHFTRFGLVTVTVVLSSPIPHRRVEPTGRMGINAR